MKNKISWIDLDNPSRSLFTGRIARRKNLVRNIYDRCNGQLGAIQESLFSDGENNSMESKHKLVPMMLPNIDIKRIQDCWAVSPGLILSNKGAICWSNKQFSKQAICNWFGGNIDNLFSEIDKKEQVCINDDCILLTRPGDHIYGHWLVDILPRVWLAESYKKNQFKYLVRNNSPSYVYDLLELVGVEADQIMQWDPSKQVARLTSAYVPSGLRYNFYFHPLIKEFGVGLRNKYADNNYEGPSSEKIYVTRNKWSDTNKKEFRILENSDALEEIAKQKGYMIISPETLSIRDQINVFSNVKIIIGEDGSGLHNSIFSPENTIVCSLRSPYNGALIQGSLCAAYNQSMAYIIGKATNKPDVARNANYVIDENVFRKSLDAIDKHLTSIS